MRSRLSKDMARVPVVAHSALRWVGRHELGSLLLFLVLALGIWVFAEVADEVSEGATRRVDEAVLLALRARGDAADPLGPRWLEEACRDLSALGGPTVLTLLTVAAIGYLLMLRMPRAAAFVGTAELGATLLAMTLKGGFSRPRPEVVPHLVHAITPSFPSGHSMLSAAVYLTLGALLARVHSSVVLKAYVLLWALLLTFLVGVSRVYLGVHWPTDVVGGWAAGAAWAALCWLVARALQHRGNLEAPTPVGPDRLPGVDQRQL